MKCNSAWQSPGRAVRLRPSRGPGFGRLTSSIISGLLTSCRTAAFIGYSLNFCYFLKTNVTLADSLRCDEQFANLSHADGALAEQMAGDGALHRIFREPERIVCQDPGVDHHARQQQPSRIAAHLVDAPPLPRH